MQQSLNQQLKSRKGIENVRKLNKDVKPLSIKNTNDSMKMKSKSFSVTRRTSNSPTNHSPKAVSHTTSGMKGAGKSIGHKKFTATRVEQHKPAQQSMTGKSPIKMTVSTQPKATHTKTSMGRKPTYLSVQKSLKKTMGY